MVAVRVEFTLRTPMIEYAGSKTLDALWAWAAVKRAQFEGVEDAWAHQHSTGIAIHRTGEQWCPMASELEVQWADVQQPVHYIKRQKLESYATAWTDGLLKKRPAFDAARGSTKAGSYFASARWTSKVQGWAMVEDMALFESLLHWVTHIGKLHHKDFGAVREATIVQDQEALQRWMMRPLPIGSDAATSDHVPVMGGLRSPYWMRSNFVPVLALARG
jgi:CRISPR type IV-associated protein Csf3